MVDLAVHPRGRLTLVALVLCTGCVERIAREERTCEESRESDAGVMTCGVDGDCPGGSLCALRDGRRLRLCPSRDAGCACAAAQFPVTHADALIRGFQAREFDLKTEPAQGEYGFEHPARAELVICGLFVADPDFARGRIENATKSLYRTHTFRGAKLATAHFRLSDLERGAEESEPSVCGNALPTPVAAEGYPTVTSLRVGCWAYDRTRVIAATQLRNVEIASLPEVKPPIFDCAARGEGDLEGRFCLSAVKRGVCSGGACREPGMLDAGSLSVDAAMAAMGSREEGGLVEPGRYPVVVDTGFSMDGGLTAPVALCSESTEGLRCEIGAEMRAGRCVGSRCAAQELATIERPLVVERCASPESQPDDAGPVPHDDVESDWLNCIAPSVQGYGSCYRRICRLRCVTSADCEPSPPASRASETVRGRRCAKGCVLGTTSYVGVCLEPAEAVPSCPD